MLNYHLKELLIKLAYFTLSYFLTFYIILENAVSFSNTLLPIETFYNNLQDVLTGSFYLSLSLTTILNLPFIKWLLVSYIAKALEKKELENFNFLFNLFIIIVIFSFILTIYVYIPVLLNMLEILGDSLFNMQINFINLINLFNGLLSISILGFMLPMF